MHKSVRSKDGFGLLQSRTERSDRNESEDLVNR